MSIANQTGSGRTTAVEPPSAPRTTARSEPTHLGRPLVETVQDPSTDEASDTPADLDVDRQNTSELQWGDFGRIGGGNIDLYDVPDQISGFILQFKIRTHEESPWNAAGELANQEHRRGWREKGQEHGRNHQYEADQSRLLVATSFDQGTAEENPKERSNSSCLR